MLGADFISNAGSGIVLPFLAVYISRVRHQGPEVGVITIAVVAVGSLFANPVAGWAADRYGARPVVITGWIVAALADVFLLIAKQVPVLFGAALITGIGAGTSYPAVPALLASVTPSQQRPLVYSTRHGLLNLGFSGGIVISAIVVAVPDLAHFRLLFAADAASFLIAGIVLARPATSANDHFCTDGADADETTDPVGYRTLLADPALRRFCLVQLLIVAFGYAQFHAALPVFLSSSDGLSPAAIAIVFLTNTVVVAVVAIPATVLSARIPRTRVICGGAVCFGSAWTALAFSPGHTSPALTVACLAATAMGVGEVALASAMPALLNDLAPEHLRGRYNAADAITASGGSIAGPLLVAVLFASSGRVTMLTLSMGCTLAAIFALTIFAHAPGSVQAFPRGDQEPVKASSALDLRAFTRPAGVHAREQEVLPEVRPPRGEQSPTAGPA